MSDPDRIGIDELLSSILARSGWEGSIVSAWVLVAEVLTSDDTLQLVTVTDPVAPYWRHRGMLTACSLEPEPEVDDYYDD
jgi:hypothetical protein